MSNENYSPDEIRLLDEFAGRWFCEHHAEHDLQPQEWASDAYLFAAAMIAERRKRVGSQQVAVVLPTRRMEPPVIESTDPEPQPEPERQPSGELTEEAVSAFVKRTKDSFYYSDFHLTQDDIDRAVALMREGLTAKQHHANALQMLAHNIERNKKLDEENRTLHDERTDARVALSLAEKERDTYKRLLDGGAQPVGHTAMKQANDLLTEGLALAVKERDDARDASSNSLSLMRAAEACTAMATMRAEKAEKERDEARAELGTTKQWYSATLASNAALADKLAAAQPVLDAVVKTHPLARQDEVAWFTEAHRVLQSYADRHRNEAKQQGGAS